MASVVMNPMLGIEERSAHRSPEFRALLTTWMLFELRKREGLQGGTAVTMLYNPAIERILVKSSEGKEWIVQTDLLVELRSELGTAARNALQHPSVTVSVQI